MLTRIDELLSTRMSKADRDTLYGLVVNLMEKADETEELLRTRLNGNYLGGVLKADSLEAQSVSAKDFSIDANSVSFGRQKVVFGIGGIKIGNTSQIKDGHKYRHLVLDANNVIKFLPEVEED